MLKRLLAVLLLVPAAIGACTPSATASPVAGAARADLPIPTHGTRPLTLPGDPGGYPSCLNYNDVQPWGRVNINATATYVNVFWYINPLSHTPGEYLSQVYINGRTLGGVNYAMKSDTYHFAVPRVQNGRTVIRPGDIFHVEMYHPFGTIMYVALYAYCAVP